MGASHGRPEGKNSVSKYCDYINRAMQQHGEKFSNESLAVQFVPYFNSGERIKIITSYGETLTGTVGVTTGWVPIFLLMRRSGDHGSSITLLDRDVITHIKRGRDYVPVHKVASVA